MNDRRDGLFCTIHDMDFQRCPCPERRNTTDRVEQILVCVKCGRHCSRCTCAEPELEVRGAA